MVFPHIIAKNVDLGKAIDRPGWHSSLIRGCQGASHHLCRDSPSSSSEPMNLCSYLALFSIKTPTKTFQKTLWIQDMPNLRHSFEPSSRTLSENDKYVIPCSSWTHGIFWRTQLYYLNPNNLANNSNLTWSLMQVVVHLVNLELFTGSILSFLINSVTYFFNRLRRASKKLTIQGYLCITGYLFCVIHCVSIV